GDRHFAEDVLAFALEELVGPHVNKDIQVPRRPASLARFAFAFHPQSLAVVNAGGHLHLQTPGAPLQTSAQAVAAGRLGQAAGAAASGTRLHIDEPPEHRLAHLADLAPAVALRARPNRRARLRPVAAAVAADLRPGHADLHFGSESRLFEVDVQ